MRTTRNQNRDNAKQIAPEEPPFRVKAVSMGLRAGLDPAKLSQFEAELDEVEFARTSQGPRRGKSDQSSSLSSL